MGYTKGQIIEQVYLFVHGGQLSPDVNIRRQDIIPYLGAAINYILTKEVRARRREEQGMNATGVDPEFLGTYYQDVIYDDQRGLKYLLLPVRVASIPGNDAISVIAAVGAEVPFTKIRDQFEDITIRRILPNNTRYWYEKIGNQERIYFTNISPVVTKVMIRLVASIDSIGDDERLPLPDGMEIEVLELVKQWFIGQRQLPADMLNNNKDDGNAAR